MMLNFLLGYLIPLGVCWIVNSIILWIVLNKFSELEDPAPFKKCMFATLLMVISAIVSGYCSFIPLIGVLIFVVVWYKLCGSILESVFEMDSGTDLPVFIFLVVYVALKYGMYRLFSAA